MDPASIILPLTSLAVGSLATFLGASVWYERRFAALRVDLDIPGSAPAPQGDGWTEPPRMVIHADKHLDPATTEALTSALATARARITDVVAADGPPAWLMSEHAELAGSAIFRTAQALAELSRYQQEGPANDRFPLDEDVELFLAKALTDTINILLAHQPSEHERGELAQLEAALYKFQQDYGA